MALTKAHNRMIEGAPINVRDYGAKGDGVTDDTAALQAALVAAENNELWFDGDATYLCSAPLAVYPNTTIKGCGCTVNFLAQANRDFMAGWLLSSGCKLSGVNGYRSNNGYTVTISSAYVVIGLFYGVGLSTRAEYVGSVPGIVDANSAVGNWDAPENVIIEDIVSDLRGVVTTTNYSNSVIFLTNFVRNITINNIKGYGFATYVNAATSLATTGATPKNTNNYYDVVRFEWGNFVSPAAHASGENIRVSNIYGSGLMMHDHSAVVSMGNAHSFVVENVVGKATGQVFHCGSSGDATTLDPSVLRTNATNRKVTNVTGLDLYTWVEGIHYCAGVNVTSSDYTATSAISPFNSITIENVNLTGLYDATATPTRPHYGILIGDQTWSADTRHVKLSNCHVSKFDQGILINDANNVTVSDSVVSFNGKIGISVAGSTTSFGRHIVFENCYIKDNNEEGYTTYTTNSGVGASVFRGDNVVFRDCIFGSLESAVGSETQLHSVFLRNGNVGLVRFEGCSFTNYESASSYDIYTNSTAIQPTIKDCRGVINADSTVKALYTPSGLEMKVVGSCKFTAAPSTVTVTQNANMSTGSYLAVGRYDLNFDIATPNANYYVMATASGAGTPEYFPVHYAAASSTAKIQLYVKDAAGANIDPANPVEVVVFYVDTPADLGNALP